MTGGAEQPRPGHGPAPPPGDVAPPGGGAAAAHQPHAHDGPPHAHRHTVGGDADRRWLGTALALIATFMAGEVVVGVLAHSLALLSDAAHMLTDAAALALALLALRLAARPARGAYTYGLKRVEILSAQANGVTLLLLGVWLTYEAIRRLVSPSGVTGAWVLGTALAGVVVNLAATLCLSRANRDSLNIAGAFQHVATDLAGFAATALAGVVVLTTGFNRADAIASLAVVALMVVAGTRLVRDSGRIFLEAAPPGIDPHQVGERLAAAPAVTEVHDLHVWTITSGQPALSAHVLVAPAGDCHAVRGELEELLLHDYAIAHTTLQVDHAPESVLRITRRAAGAPAEQPPASAHAIPHATAPPEPPGGAGG